MLIIDLDEPLEICAEPEPHAAFDKCLLSDLKIPRQHFMRAMNQTNLFWQRSWIVAHPPPPSSNSMA
jgi:hypothetical protein